MEQTNRFNYNENIAPSNPGINFGHQNQQEGFAQHGFQSQTGFVNSAFQPDFNGKSGFVQPPQQPTFVPPQRYANSYRNGRRNGSIAGGE